MASASTKLEPLENLTVVIYTVDCYISSLRNYYVTDSFFTVKRRLHIRFLALFGILLTLNIVPYAAKSSGQYLTQILHFAEG